MLKRIFRDFYLICIRDLFYTLLDVKEKVTSGLKKDECNSTNCWDTNV